MIPTDRRRALLSMFAAHDGPASLPELFAPKPVPLWSADAARTLDELGLLERFRDRDGTGKTVWRYRLTDDGREAATGSGSLRKYTKQATPPPDGPRPPNTPWGRGRRLFYDRPDHRDEG